MIFIVRFYCYMLWNEQCHRDSLMHYDVVSYVICTSHNVEYLEKEGSYKNSSKVVTLSF